jgi:hypothetical protein
MDNFNPRVEMLYIPGSENKKQLPSHAQVTHE